MEFVTIGNPNNAADTTGSPNPVGAVAYTYNLGKYEVSRDMVSKANAAGNLGLTLGNLASFGGNGTNRPATEISWYEAARFVNWLNTNQGYPAAYKFSGTNFAVWTNGDAGYQASNPYRNTQARYFLPSSDEWYKGAYGSPGGAWYNFATGSDTAPTAVSGGTNASTTVYGQTSATGPTDITNAGGLSAYGTMAQGGNIHEWMETATDGVNNSATENRDWRGGRWTDGTSANLDSSNRFNGAPTYESATILGFRVASADLTALDSDGDGLSDAVETGTGIYVSPTDTGTDPNHADTDGDGISDGVEVNTSTTNPLLADTDGDGLSDSQEVALGTNPKSVDTDGDGLNDNVETDTGTFLARPGGTELPVTFLIATNNIANASDGGTLASINPGSISGKIMHGTVEAGQWFLSDFRYTRKAVGTTRTLTGAFFTTNTAGNPYSRGGVGIDIHTGGNEADGVMKFSYRVEVAMSPGYRAAKIYFLGNNPAQSRNYGPALATTGTGGSIKVSGFRGSKSGLVVDPTDRLIATNNHAYSSGDDLQGFKGAETVAASTVWSLEVPALDPVTYAVDVTGQSSMSSEGTAFSVQVFQENTGTSPVAADTDDDGLNDAVETNTGTYVSAANTGTNPNHPDTDGDGLNDGAEVNTLSTSPFVSQVPGSLVTRQSTSSGFVATWGRVADAAGYEVQVSTEPSFTSGLIGGDRPVSLGTTTLLAVTGVKDQIRYYRVRSVLPSAGGPLKTGWSPAVSAADMTGFTSYATLNAGAAVNDSLAIDDPSLPNNNSYTVTFWMRPDGIGGISGTENVQVFRQGINSSNNTANIDLDLMPDGSLVFGQKDPAMVEKKVQTAAKTILASNWYHVGMVRDATNATLKLYVNGLCLATNTSAFGITNWLINNTGGPGATQQALNNDGNTNRMRGAFDDIRVYRTVRSSSQILDDISGPLDRATASNTTTFYAPFGGSTLTSTNSVYKGSFQTATGSVTALSTLTSPVLSWTPNPAATLSAPATLANSVLTATAKTTEGVTIPGSWTYTPAAGTSLSVGTNAVVGTFVPSDLNSYSIGAITNQIVVAPASPNNIDTDGDGFGDALELAAGTSPDSAASRPASSRRLLVWGGEPFVTNSVMSTGVSQAVVAEVSGDTNVISVLKNGSVTTWSLFGNSDSTFDVPAGATSDVAMIAAGDEHFLALKSDGSVVAWGKGKSNTNGLPEFGQSIVPADAQSGVVAVAAGGYHSLALRGDGRVVAWGWNNYQQTEVPAAASNGVVAVAAGRYVSLALKADGTVVGWGRGSYGATVPSDAQSGVIAISAGRNHAMALKSDGTVKAWGNPPVEQITTSLGSPAGLTGVTAISAGRYYSMALKSDRTLQAWGETFYADETFPVPAQLTNVVAIQGAMNHGLAVVSDGPAPRLNLGGGPIRISPGASTNLATLISGVGASFGSVGLPAGVTLMPSGILNAEGSVASTNVIVRLITANTNGEDARVVQLQVGKATPTISAAPTASTISYGESLGASTLTGGTASVPGTFAFKTPATTPNAGLAQNFKVVFTPTDTANYELVEIDVPVTVNKAAATVNVSDLNQVYNGSPRPVTVTTVPASLAISVQYNGGATVPTNAGSYPVQVTVTDANHTGAKSEVLTIAKADLLLSALPTASAITYGQTLTASTLSGGQAKLGTDVVAGSFAFTTPTAAPGAGPASQGVTFTPTDITNYNPATTTVSVTVNTKNLTITGISVSNKQFDGTTTASITGTASYVGLVLGETFAVVGAPTAAFVTPDVGTTKPVTVSGFAAPSANYTVTQPSGLTASITPAVNLDTDEDGLTDGQEVTLGSNPNNALSMPKTKLVYWGPASGVAAANVPANLPSDIVKISAGENFALALSSAGRVYAWGANESGQTNVPLAAQSGVVDILAAGGAGNGGGFAYARKADGSVVGWGSSASIGSLPGNIVKMAGWGNQGLLLDSSGRAYQRGPDNLGTASVNSDSAWQSGLTDIGAARYNHIAVKAGAARVVGIVNHNSLVVPAEAQANVQSVIAHGGSTLTATLSNNQVVMWGKVDSGQISGLRNIVQAGSLPGVSVTRTNSGTANSGWEELVLSQSGTPSIRKFFPTQSYWSGLIDKDGKVWVWGNPANGLPTATVPAAMTANVVQAVGGGNFALALVLDQDGDGLADNVETNTGTYVSADNTGTDPAAADTDGDGLNDGVETKTGTFVSVTNTGTDPTKTDTDGDGLNDNVETGTGVFVSAANTGTDPTKADTDGDGLNDNVETKTGTYVSGTDTGTDPLQADTDADGVNDGTELVAGTNPFLKPSFPIHTFSVAFNGTSTQRVISPRPVQDDFTFSFWIKTSVAGIGSTHWFEGSGLLDGEVGGVTEDFGTSLMAGGKVGFGVGNPDTTLISTKSVNDNLWHHVVFTREAANGAMRIYVDGVLDRSGTGPTGTKAAPTRLTLGSLQTNLRFFAGSMADFQIYDRVASGVEVWQLANRISIAGSPAVATLLVDADADGLDDSIDPDPTQADTDGDGLTDGQEVNSYGSNPSLVDTDSDGAGDKLEADLGNSLTVANVYNRLINGSFEDGTVKPSPGSQVVVVPQDGVPGWKTTAVNTTNAADQFKIELWYSGFTPPESGGSAGGDGSTLAELNYVASETLYQDVVMTVDGAVSYSFLHRGRNDTETIEFKIDRLVAGPGSTVEANFFTRTVSTGNGAWVRYRGTPPGTVQAGKTYRFSYRSVIPATGGGGNLLDGASFEIDQDADGLTDSLETNTGTYVSVTNTGTNPLDDDSDNDGLKDGEEVFVHGTNPLLADTDGDGLNDNVETKTGTYVSGTDTGTDPLKADTDGDGLNDKMETKTGTFVSETDTGTDPSVADTDGDGVSDGVEIADGTNPNNVFNFKTTTNFVYTGSFQSFTVPEGVSQISFTLLGADGAAFSNGYSVLGGQGGTVTGTLNVIPGQTLKLGVGGAGNSNVGGWNGGGSDPFNRGGGGGGATDLFLSTTDWANLVAIAGGGSGGNAVGGFGGSGAGEGPNNGSFLNGSNGDGGGGGGYYGGLGGVTGGPGGRAGGGGSSWVDSSKVTTSSIAGGSDGTSNGSIQLRYVAEPIPRITAAPSPATGTVGGAASFPVTAETPGAGTAGLTYQWRKNGEEIPGATGSTFNLSILAVDNEGSYSVTVSNLYGSATSSEALLTVNKATPGIELPPLAGELTYGQTLSQAGLTGGTAKIGGLEVDGFFSFDSGDLKPAVGVAEQNITFTPLDSDNYNSVTLKVPVTVAKANLRAIAEDKSRSYRSGNPAFTVRYIGLVAGDTALEVVPVMTTTATPASVPGTYPITISAGVLSSNYTVEFVGGTLTVLDGDFDQDGASDSSELAAGTDPANPADRPMLLSAGWNHTLYVPQAGGYALAWGLNTDGRCGVGHTNSPLTTGVRTVGADGKELSGIIQAAAGGGHSLLLQNLGGQITLLAAGANANGQLGITNAFSDRFLPVASGLPTNLLAIAAGARHSLALDTDGKVYAWGDNLQGQVGVNTNRSVIRTPTRVTNALAALRIKAVAAGAEHSLVLAEDGKVYSWGRGNGGALGYTALGAVRAPRQITNLSSIRQIAAGDKHSLFLNAGKVYACGDNSLGQLGLPSSVLFTNTPVEIPFPGGVTIRKLVAGLDRCLAIAEDGRVFGWGYNRYGELGLGFASTNAPFAVFQPQEVKALYGATEIAGGGFQTFALGSSGTLLASGLNEGGQLGVGGTNNVSSAPAPTKEAGKRDQILTFELPGPLPVGTPVVLAGFSTPVIPLAGDLGAGPVPVLGVSYVSSDVSVASVLDGVLTLHRPGTVTITATQSGNDLYNAAAPVSRTITVVKGTADILIGGLRQSFDGTPKPVQVTTVPPGLAVNITYNGGAGAPQAIGVYEVAVTVVDDNYQRIVQQNLEIRPYLTLEMATAEATYDLGSGPQILDTTVRAEGAPATLSAASVRIEEGLVAGDVLALTNPPAGITASWSAARGLLRLSGAASVADYQTALRRVTFATTSTNTNNRVINMTLGSAVGHAGHAYEYVSQNLTWPDARTAAKGRSLFLENGYLANVTSAGENQAVLGLLQEAGKDAWLGGADTTDGNFRWMDGPNSEAGSKFWNGNSGGSGVGGQFANWGAGQPDNKSWVVGREIDYILFVPIYKNIYDYESFLMMSHSTSLALGGNSYPSSPGKWNDAPLKTSANSFYRLGSVVEYGGSQPVFFTDQRTLQVRPNPFANNVNFTSTASEISVPMPTAAMGGMTLEFWMKPASGLGSGTYSVVRKNSPLGSSELSVSLNYSSSTIASLSATVTPAAGSPATASANLIDPLAWNHVALVVSGSSVQFFINGTAGSSAMLMGALALSNQPLVFGSSFRGQIDDIRIYSGVRSGSQISADKTGPALAPYDSSLVAYYKLDEGSGTALADATGVNGAATGGNIGWGPGRSPGVWDITSGDYRLQDDGSSLLLELGGLEGTTLYDQIFVWNGAATLDGIINLMFIGAYTGPVSGSWHTFDLIWAKNGIVFGDNYQLSFNQPGLTVETNVVEKDGGQLWQATIREAVSQADLEQAAALAQPALGISRSPGPAGTVEMMYTYTRPAGGSYVGGQYAANGVRYEVQVSGDLKTWVPAALEEVGAVPAGAGYENVTVKIVSGSPKAFLKLKISN